MSNFNSLKIRDVKRETNKAISIVFDVPSDLQADYNFIAGQYINLKININGKEIRRAYSICSPSNSNELRIAIKAVSKGFFSEYANTQIKKGDTLEVGIPEGKFTFEPEIFRHKNYVAFAAGSGITPIMSILTTVLKNESLSSFVLVYGNKTPEETIFYQQLHDLQLQYTGRLFVYFIYSQVKIEGNLFGRIERSTVNFILKNKHKEMEFSKFYLCGPEKMITIVSDVLKENNIKESKIKFELFTASSEEHIIEKSLNGQTKISILIDDDETTFVMSQQITILEAALKQGIDAPYSCQGGICSSCLARITSGTAEMKKNSILTDGEIADGLILTCQAHPTSDSISVNYDDV